MLAESVVSLFTAFYRGDDHVFGDHFSVFVLCPVNRFDDDFNDVACVDSVFRLVFGASRTVEKKPSYRTHVERKLTVLVDYPRNESDEGICRRSVDIDNRLEIGLYLENASELGIALIKQMVDLLVADENDLDLKRNRLGIRCCDNSVFEVCVHILDFYESVSDRAFQSGPCIVVFQNVIRLDYKKSAVRTVQGTRFQPREIGKKRIVVLFVFKVTDDVLESRVRLVNYGSSFQILVVDEKIDLVFLEIGNEGLHRIGLAFEKIAVSEKICKVVHRKFGNRIKIFAHTFILSVFFRKIVQRFGNYLLDCRPLQLAHLLLVFLFGFTILMEVCYEFFLKRTFVFPDFLFLFFVKRLVFLAVYRLSVNNRIKNETVFRRTEGEIKFCRLCLENAEAFLHRITVCLSDFGAEPFKILAFHLTRDLLDETFKKLIHILDELFSRSRLHKKHIGRIVVLEIENIKDIIRNRQMFRNILDIFYDI